MLTKPTPPEPDGRAFSFAGMWCNPPGPMKEVVRFFELWQNWIALREQVSVHELLDDVIEKSGFERYLRDEPILSRPISLAPHLWQ